MILEVLEVKSAVPHIKVLNLRTQKKKPEELKASVRIEYWGTVKYSELLAQRTVIPWFPGSLVEEAGNPKLQERGIRIR